MCLCVKAFVQGSGVQQPRWGHVGTVPSVLQIDEWWDLAVFELLSFYFLFFFSLCSVLLPLEARRVD